LYQVSALIEDKPDVFGLDSWNEYKDVVNWDSYDLVWVHLNPRIMEPAWFDYPSLIRKKIGKTPMIVSHEYFEKYYNEKMEWQVELALLNADYISVNTRVAKDIIENSIFRPVIYTSISQPMPDYMAEFPKPLSFMDKYGVVVVDHSVNPEDYDRLFETLSMIKFPITMLTSNHTKDESWCDEYMEKYGIKIKVYPRMEHSKYLDKLNEARVALELGYVGISRMAYECAKVHTPVVGHDKLEFRNILYPVQTTDDPLRAVQLIHQLHTDETYWLEVCDYADNLLYNFWSKDEVNKRYQKLLRKILNESKDT
jgi:hypothetical protein